MLVEASAKQAELPTFGRLHLAVRAAAGAIRSNARKNTPAAVLALVKTRAEIANAERLQVYVGAGWVAPSSTRRCDSSLHMGPEPEVTWMGCVRRPATSLQADLTTADDKDSPMVNTDSGSATALFLHARRAVNNLPNLRNRCATARLHAAGASSARRRR